MPKESTPTGHSTLKRKLFTTVAVIGAIAIEFAVFSAVWSGFQTVTGAIVVGTLALFLVLWLGVFARR